MLHSLHTAVLHSVHRRHEGQEVQRTALQCTQCRPFFRGGVEGGHTSPPHAHRGAFSAHGAHSVSSTRHFGQWGEAHASQGSQFCESLHGQLKKHVLSLNTLTKKKKTYLRCSVPQVRQNTSSRKSAQQSLSVPGINQPRSGSSCASGQRAGPDGPDEALKATATAAS